MATLTGLTGPVGLWGCQPEVIGRACKGAAECFHNERCVGGTCVEKSRLLDATLSSTGDARAIPDGGGADAAVDAASLDAAALDAAPVDAAPVDAASSADMWPLDASPPDATTPEDAGAPDQGEPELDAAPALPDGETDAERA